MGDTRQHVVIIGGGLAGTLMAARLCLEGVQVTLVDDRDPQAASRVAAGLYNIITGRAGAKTWMADTLVEELNAFFALEEFEELRQFRHQMPIYRPFHDVEDYNKWLGRSQEAAYAPWVRFHERPYRPDLIHNPFGGIMIEGCGWVEIGPMIEKLQAILEFRYHLRRLTGFLEPDSIDLENRSIKLRAEDLSYTQIVFANGYKLTEHPYFEGLPIRPNKGETLLLESSAVLPHAVVRKGYFIPSESGIIAGSTYQNTFTSNMPTEEGKQTILENFSGVINSPFNVIKHKAGIRATSPNRKPLIGTHPLGSSSIFVLAGFGAKGLLFSFWSSKLLSKMLLDNDTYDLPFEANVQRYWSEDLRTWVPKAKKK